MNSCVFVGRLASDPEIKTVGSGTQLCEFRFAVPKERERDQADFIKMVAFGKTAENLHKYAVKGQQVAIQASVDCNAWKDKEGKNHVDVKFIVQRFELLSKGKDGTKPASGPGPASAVPAGIPEGDILDDDLPF